MSGDRFPSKRFQSTPPAEARGDVLPPSPSATRTCFNPLPPPKRGETSTMPGATGSKVFQSTPPAEARGDHRHAGGIVEHDGFNPLPPPKRGETVQIGRVRRVADVSIHSPRRSEGRQPTSEGRIQQ